MSPRSIAIRDDRTSATPRRSDFARRAPSMVRNNVNKSQVSGHHLQKPKTGGISRLVTSRDEPRLLRATSVMPPRRRKAIRFKSEVTTSRPDAWRRRRVYTHAAGNSREPYTQVVVPLKYLILKPLKMTTIAARISPRRPGFPSCEKKTRKGKITMQAKWQIAPSFAIFPDRRRIAKQQISEKKAAESLPRYAGSSRMRLAVPKYRE